MVDDLMMCLAQKDAKFLHCLPAYRGQEVSESVLEAHSKIVFDEAHNRLHAQKGLMVWLHKQLS
jgi:ornithine carbamoyltransferase